MASCLLNIVLSDDDDDHDDDDDDDDDDGDGVGCDDGGGDDSGEDDVCKKDYERAQRSTMRTIDRGQQLQQ